MQIFAAVFITTVDAAELVLKCELNSFDNPHSDCLSVVMQEGYNRTNPELIFLISLVLFSFLFEEDCPHRNCPHR